MKRPARATGGRRGRVVHAVVRIVLVCALVVLLALIAVRELQGFGRAVAGRPAGISSTALTGVAGGPA